MFACNKSSHYHRQLCSISCKLGSSQSICSFPALNFVHLLCHFRCRKLLYISLKTGKRLQPHNVRSFFKRVVVSIWQKGAYKLLIFFLAGFCTNVRGKKSLAAEMRNCVSVKLKTISGPLIMLLFFFYEFLLLVYLVSFVSKPCPCLPFLAGEKYILVWRFWMSKLVKAYENYLTRNL